MDDTTIAHINGSMLTWARERMGYEISAIAQGNITIAKVTEWEQGTSLPSEAEAETLAKSLGIPYAMLFMPMPPTNVPPGRI